MLGITRRCIVALNQKACQLTCNRFFSKLLKQKQNQWTERSAIYQGYKLYNIRLCSHQVTIATIRDDTEMVQTKWLHDNRVLSYPYLWLLDNCQCEKCCNPDNQARMPYLIDLDVDAKPQHVSIDENAKSLMVSWNNGHVSPFKFDWLWKRRFADDGYTEREKAFCKKPILWGSEFQTNIPRFNFSDIMSEDSLMHAWLSKWEETGLVLIEDVPKELGQIQKLVKKISFQRTTHYGDTFKVWTRPDARNPAYSTATLGLHTDLPHYVSPPGAQLLHCIIQAPGEGGASTFVDGFNIAQKMQKQYPQYYDALCELPIDFTDMGSDVFGKFHKLTSQPSISFDAHNNISVIRFSQFIRDTYIRVPANEVNILLRALHKFLQLAYSDENLVTIKLQPGEMVCFNNHRLVHGRTGYTMTTGSERLLEGVYLDWDEPWSRRRVIEQELGIAS